MSDLLRRLQRLEAELNRLKRDRSEVSSGGGIPEAPFDGSTYGRNNGAWSVVAGGGSAAWGTITGTLSNQTDLQAALNGKASLTGATFTGPVGTTSTIDGRDVAADGAKLDGIESGATADENFANANQTILTNRTIDDDNKGRNVFFDLETPTGTKAQVLINPVVPSITVQGNDGAGNIGGYAVGSANTNLTFTGTCDLRINGAPGTSGQVLTSNGVGSAPSWTTPAGGGGGTTVGLLSATRATSQTIGTSLATFVWDSPGLNQDAWTYSAGVFTVPAGINGSFLEFDITLNHDSTGVVTRAQWTAELQKDTGSGYTTVARFSNYTARNTTQSEGGINLSYIDPVAAATGDDWRVQLLRVGNGASSSTNGCFISIKSYT